MHEKSDMTTELAAEQPAGSHWGVLAGAALVAGGLVASLIAAGTAGAATTSMVSTAKSAKYGTILVSGNTVYTLKASKMPCGAKCLKIWPEVLLPTGVTAATAGPGVNAAKLGTVVGQGGALQVTYGGQAALLVLQGHPSGTGEGKHQGQVGFVVRRRDGEAAGSSSNSGSGSGSGGSPAREVSSF